MHQKNICFLMKVFSYVVIHFMLKQFIEVFFFFLWCKILVIIFFLSSWDVDEYVLLKDTNPYVGVQIPNLLIWNLMC